MKCELHQCCHGYVFALFPVKYALRPKKQLSIEHIREQAVCSLPGTL